MDEDLRESIANNYDRLAEAYARQLFHELKRKPLDRQLLEAFAARTAGRGEVCDMGCGPGQVARYLRDLGATVFGLDLSPQMVLQAQKLNPDIPFREGNMLAMDMDDGVLAGIVAFYAIVNIPFESLHLVFEEMARVLEPGGLLLLAFHVGDEVLRPPQLWEVSIAMDFFFFPPAVIRRLLEKAGFDIEKVIEREPYGSDVEHQSRRAYILARKAQ
jgi:SAM-dependent methyltransferase